MSILYAATFPERVHALVIYSSYARRLWAPDYPWGFRPEERARYAAQLEQDWAWEADMRHMCPNADEELAQWWGERCRAATSPGAARALIEMASLVDVRDVLGAVQAPTLVLHRRHDIDSHVEEGRYLADRIPGARFVELEGTDHFVGVDPDQILDPVEEFVRGLGSSTPTETSLTTLLAVHLERPIDTAWIRGILQAAVESHPACPPWPSTRTCWPPSTARAGGSLRAGGRRAGSGRRPARSRSGLHTAEIARRGATCLGRRRGHGAGGADRAPTRRGVGDLDVARPHAGIRVHLRSHGPARGPVARPHHRARCGDLTCVQRRRSPTPEPDTARAPRSGSDHVERR